MNFNHTVLRFVSLALIAIPALALSGCGSSGEGIGAGIGTGSGSGKAALFLENMQWGRLVDLFDIDGDLVERDVVIRENVVSDGILFELSQNPVTQKEVLKIFAQSDSADFSAALSSARSGLTSLQAKSFEDAGPFTKVARNGAIRLVFSEFLDPNSVERQTIQVQIGNDESDFQTLEVRYIVKEAIGQDGTPKGVVILDSTISKLDSQELGIPENGVGFPESDSQLLPNIKIRIPTTINPFINQTLLLKNKAKSHSFGVLRNLAGNSIVEPHEFAGLDVVSIRALRSGNKLDTFNGFLTDTAKPSLIVTQAATITSVSQAGQQRTLVYSIDAVNCRDLSPKEGDVFEIAGALLQVTLVLDDSDSSAYIIRGVLLAGTLPGGSTVLPASLTTRYTAADALLQLCFLTITPAPLSLPANGVDPFATISVRFSEPIDVSTMRSLDSMVLSSGISPGAGGKDDEWNSVGGETVPVFVDRLPGFGRGGGAGRIMFGPVEPSGDAQSFTLAPLAGITDAFVEGPGLQVSLALRDGNTGILDLAGNTVDFSSFVAGHSSQVEQFSLIPGGIPSDKYFALRGNGVDEDGDQAPEYAGQLGPILGDGILRGRSITRFSRQADQTNQFVGQRLKFTQGLMTPLTPAGAVLMTLYGYHHLGFGLSSSGEFNLDVEGLNWAPFEGVVFDDTFDRYSLALAHSARFPDDFIDPGNGYPSHYNSGLKRLSGNNFDQNIYGFGQDPVKYQDLDEVVVFDSTYEISSVNRFQTPGGVTMYPWSDFDETYTWRDTHFPVPNGSSLVGGNPVGGDTPINPGGYGVPPHVITSDTPTWFHGYYPSIALPLLMRFRSYPRGQEFGFNGFQVQIMVGSSNIPAFRVFSSGGRDGGDVWHLVRPDLAPEGTAPNGGYNTITGATTKGFGPELYWGQVDFVTRVSKVYTHWFDFGGTLASMSSLTIEPTVAQAKPNTSVEVQFRSSASVDDSGCGASTSPLEDAIRNFDSYADYSSAGCGVISQPSDWYSDPTELVADGRQFFQLRFTFISNIEQDLEAELDAFGFAFLTN